MNKNLQKAIAIIGFFVVAEVINEVAGYKVIDVELKVDKKKRTSK